MNNYLETARENELAFRAILESAGFEQKNMSLEEIHEKYSQGNRSGVLAILDFEKKETDHFEFTWENIGVLSGIGKCELWSFANGSARFVKAINVWMS